MNAIRERDGEFFAPEHRQPQDWNRLTAFKPAVVFLQIYARYCRGTTADPRIAGMGPTADALFDFAAEVKAGRVF